MPSASWLNGWLTGDIVTAAEYRKSMGSVFDTTVGVAAASIDTGAIIPASYSTLRIMLQARGDTAALTTNVLLRFNNDSAANYDALTFQGFGTTTASSETFAGTSISLAAMAANTAPASVFTQMEITVANYAGTTANKTCTTLITMKQGTTAGLLNAVQVAGFWRSSAAINRVSVTPAAGNFQVGTRFGVWVQGV